MDTYGAILKKRIKEMGYTQEQFAEETGIPFGTLKKYLSGKSYYPIDLLKIFAEKLDCSYDYLMGFTVSPKREFQSMKDSTRLSDIAIRKLQDCGRVYDMENGHNIADAMSRIIETDNMMELFTLYLYPGDILRQGMEEYINIAKEQMNVEDMDLGVMGQDTYTLLSIMATFMKCKNNISK